MPACQPGVSQVLALRALICRGIFERFPYLFPVSRSFSVLCFASTRFLSIRFTSYFSRAKPLSFFVGNLSWCRGKMELVALFPAHPRDARKQGFTRPHPQRACSPPANSSSPPSLFFQNIRECEELFFPPQSVCIFYQTATTVTNPPLLSGFRDFFHLDLGTYSWPEKLKPVTVPIERSGFLTPKFQF